MMLQVIQALGYTLAEQVQRCCNQTQPCIFQFTGYQCAVRQAAHTNGHVKIVSDQIHVVVTDAQFDPDLRVYAAKSC